MLEQSYADTTDPGDHEDQAAIAAEITAVAADMTASGIRSQVTPSAPA